MHLLANTKVSPLGENERELTQLFALNLKIVWVSYLSSVVTLPKGPSVLSASRSGK